MKLRKAVQQYTEWRRSYGAKFAGQALLLNIFLKSIDEETGCDDVTNAQVCAFLKGNRTLTSYRAKKYSALAGFYRFAISRGYASRSPLPDNEPKSPTPAPPYVFSIDELHRLFAVIDVSRRTPLQLDTSTFRVLLLLLYGTGLRRGEALKPDLGRCRSVGRGADGTRYEVLQDASRSGGAATRGGVERVLGAARRAPSAGRRRFDLSCKPGRHGTAQGYSPSCVCEAAQDSRDRWRGRHSPTSHPALVPTQLRGPQADIVVPPRCRCATPAAGGFRPISVIRSWLTPKSICR